MKRILFILILFFGGALATVLAITNAPPALPAMPSAPTSSPQIGPPVAMLIVGSENPVTNYVELATTNWPAPPPRISMVKGYLLNSKVKDPIDPRCEILVWDDLRDKPIEISIRMPGNQAFFKGEVKK